jgi:hypothetical protein
MEKRMFQILDEMNLDDIKNNSRLVAISNTLLSAITTKKGAEIKLGVDHRALSDVLSEKAIPILVLVDKAEYFKRKSGADLQSVPPKK